MRKGYPSRIPLVICPHCNKEGGKNGMIRWHFDKCKLRKQLLYKFYIIWRQSTISNI